MIRMKEEEERVPVIDITPVRGEEENCENVELRTQKKMLDALSGSGFFFVKGHGIDETLLRDGMEMARCFFESLGEEEKMRYAANKEAGEPPLGYSGKTIVLDPDVKQKPDTREQYKVGVDGYAEAFMERSSSRVRASAPPPSAFYWPEDEIASGKLPANFKDVICAYFRAMHTLGHRLMHIICTALGTAYAPAFAAEGSGSSFSRPMHLLSMLRYDGTISDVNAALFGCGAHRDYGCLTILQLDPVVGGLEVSVGEDSAGIPLYTPVEPIEGTLVINAGAMLERWSNGRVVASLHRIVSKSSMPRFSMPFFFEPNIDAIVAPLPSCVASDGDSRSTMKPAKYEAISFASFLEHQFAKTNEVKARV